MVQTSSQAAIDPAAENPREFNPIASCLRFLGTFADPEKRRGKVFKQVESRATQAFARLATQNTFLNLVGRSMELSFLLRSQLNLNLETWWRLWRLPTSADVEDVREQLHDLHSEVEALSSQLEYLLEHLQASGGASAKLEFQGARRGWKGVVADSGAEPSHPAVGRPGPSTGHGEA